ncbi:MAG: EamA family transporter [Myxococcales bacterium]|nr:EamA family transporter [Myxococcales bacterium]MDP3505509.1 EamA family transporter [Myxococcales bacterium]
MGPDTLPQSPRNTGIAVVAAAASCWGTWPLFVRYGGQTGLVVGFLTMAVMALPALLLVRRLRFDDKGALLALVVVGVADAANVALYFSALEQGPVVVAVLTHYLAPLLVALTAPLLLKERRSRRALWALPIILFGLWLVLPGADQPGSAWNAGLLGSASALFYAALVLASRRAAVSFPPLAVTSFHAVVSAALLLIVFRERALPTQLDGGVALLMVGATINGLVGAFLFNFGLPRIGAQLTGVLTYLEPVVAAVLGVLVLHEAATVSSAVGLLVMISAGAWVAVER